MGGEPNRGPMMTRICWRLVDILSRMLDTDERQAVRGDLAESGHSIARAIRDVSDLVVRRQIGLWTVWQPWLALLGIACLAGVPLSRIAFRLNVDLGQQLMAYYTYGVHFGTPLDPSARYGVVAVPGDRVASLVMDVRIRLGFAFRTCRVAHVVRVLPHGFGFRIGKIHTVREYDPA
jgi:hypothetical protein